MDDKSIIIKKAVAETLAYLAWCGPLSCDQLLDWAKEVETFDLEDRSCCPVCSEVQCDGNCPFSEVRQ